MGQYDEEDFGVLPAAIRNLNNPVAMRSYYLLGMAGPGSDAILTEDAGEELGNYVDEEHAVVVDNDVTSCFNHGVDNQVK